jgi:TetR/AcrR family transcriptional regulator, transcriptional repressor for nem operon
MAWKDTHKQASRVRILAAAGNLFTRKGFNQVGIDEVMNAAGMTRGAFYAHFNSKSQLFEESILCAAQGAAEHLSQGEVSLNNIIDNYLSGAHLSSPNIRCPLACLVSEMAHSDQQVRGTYTKILKGFTQQLIDLQARETKQSALSDNQTTETALLQTLLLVGGMAIARSLTDTELSQQILQVAKKAAKNLT